MASPAPATTSHGPGAAEAEATAARSVVERTLTALVRQVVNGIPGVASQRPVVDTAQVLLDKCDGDVEAAVCCVAESADTAWGESCFRFLAGLVPLGGMAVRLESLWVQLRAVALVAALYGHDVSDSVICYRMLLCLVDSKLSGAGAASIQRNGKRDDPLAQGAQAVVSNVAKNVSNGGAISVLVDSLTGVSIDELVVRAREHFRPQNAFSYAWLLMLLFFCVTLKVLNPLGVLSQRVFLFASGTLEPAARFGFLLPAVVRQLPLVESVATLLVVALMGGVALGVLLGISQLLLRGVRAAPSSFSFVIMLIPPMIQAALARSAALALATAVSDGSLLVQSGNATVIGFSWHAHKALYGFCVVGSQRMASGSDALPTATAVLQWTLLYWPMEGFARWAMAGGAMDELAQLAAISADVTSTVALSLLSKELQKTQVLVKLLEWGMTGESTALCQSLMTIAAGVGGTIGSALIADPSKLVKWIDQATPSPNMCALVVAISMLAPHCAAVHAFIRNVGSFPSTLGGGGGSSVANAIQWSCALALAVSCAMNYVWQAESEQLTSRCRVFVLLPGNDRMRVLRSAVQWVATYERAQQNYKHAVSRWWSETSDGWLTFGLGGRAASDGGGDDDFGVSGVPPTDENAQPTALRRALSFLAHRGIILQPPPNPRVPGPDNRVHTQRFPSHMLAELEAAEKRVAEDRQAKLDAALGAVEMQRAGAMGDLDSRKKMTEAEPLSEARIAKLSEIERARLKVEADYKKARWQVQQRFPPSCGGAKLMPLQATTAGEEKGHGGAESAGAGAAQTVEGASAAAGDAESSQQVELELQPEEDLDGAPATTSGGPPPSVTAALTGFGSDDDDSDGNAAAEGSSGGRVVTGSATTGGHGGDDGEPEPAMRVTRLGIELGFHQNIVASPRVELRGPLADAVAVRRNSTDGYSSVTAADDTDSANDNQAGEDGDDGDDVSQDGGAEDEMVSQTDDDDGLDMLPEAYARPAPPPAPPPATEEEQDAEFDMMDEMYSRPANIAPIPRVRDTPPKTARATVSGAASIGLSGDVRTALANVAMPSVQDVQATLSTYASTLKTSAGYPPGAPAVAPLSSDEEPEPEPEQSSSTDAAAQQQREQQFEIVEFELTIPSGAFRRSSCMVTAADVGLPMGFEFEVTSVDHFFLPPRLHGKPEICFSATFVPFEEGEGAAAAGVSAELGDSRATDGSQPRKLATGAESVVEVSARRIHLGALLARERHRCSFVPMESGQLTLEWDNKSSFFKKTLLVRLLVKKSEPHPNDGGSGGGAAAAAATGAYMGGITLQGGADAVLGAFTRFRASVVGE